MDSRLMIVDEGLVTTLLIRRAIADELVDLRHRVLRTGLSREEAIFAGDELPTSRHFGAFNGTMAACCATFHLEPWKGESAWCLRGMVTDEKLRGKGVGRGLLGFAEATLLDESPIRLFWCNARVPAVRFYQSLEWKIVSDMFEIPTAGPHYVMVKRLDR